MLTRLNFRMLRSILQAGFDYLIPPYCLGCGTAGDTFCAVCRDALTPAKGLACPQCGLPRIFHQCPVCPTGAEFLKVDSIAAYKPPLRNALVAFKYRPDISFARILSGWIETKLAANGWSPGLVIPVPLHPVRLRDRGYNQVELITSTFSRISKISHGNSKIKRVRDTRTQVGLDPRQRYANMRHAFEVTTHPGHDRVLLVDDLLTSGATLLACAQALADAGVKHVYALAIARA